MSYYCQTVHYAIACGLEKDFFQRFAFHWSMLAYHTRGAGGRLRPSDPILPARLTADVPTLCSERRGRSLTAETALFPRPALRNSGRLALGSTRATRDICTASASVRSRERGSETCCTGALSRSLC